MTYIIGYVMLISKLDIVYSVQIFIESITS